MKKKLDQNQEKIAIEMYQDGYSAREIGQELGVGRSTVLRVLDKHDVKREGKNVYPRNLQRNQEETILNLYRQGYSISQIAKKLEVDWKSVRWVLGKNNIEVRPNGAKLIDTPILNFKSKQADIVKNPAQLAYLAGIIDGEGCLLIYKKKDRRGHYHYRCSLRIANTSVALMNWLTEKLGGSLARPRMHPRSKLTVYGWIFEGPKLLSLLEFVIPFMVIKPEQARIVIEMQKTLVYGATGVKLPDEILLTRDNIYSRFVEEKRKRNEKDSNTIPS